MRGKTIQIYLPNGNPRGIKKCQIKGTIATAYYIPRNKINEINNLEKVEQPGIYFLINKNEDELQPEVYIGEAENVKDRLIQHNRKKDFWKYAICFISQNNDLNKAHIKYLENYSYQKAKEINSSILQNGNTPTQSNLTDEDKDFVLDFFDQIKILISTLGFPIFDEIKKEKKNILYCIGKGVKAEGKFLEDGFIVFKGSGASDEVTNSYTKSAIKLRTRLIEQNILNKTNNIYQFTKDYIFSSPSAASDIVLARSSNGWSKWKNKEGKTLDELYRN